jgi:hypothetical protein
VVAVENNCPTPTDRLVQENDPPFLLSARFCVAEDGVPEGAPLAKNVVPTQAKGASVTELPEV